MDQSQNQLVSLSSLQAPSLMAQANPGRPLESVCSWCLAEQDVAHKPHHTDTICRRHRRLMLAELAKRYQAERGGVA